MVNISSTSPQYQIIARVILETDIKNQYIICLFTDGSTVSSLLISGVAAVGAFIGSFVALCLISKLRNYRNKKNGKNNDMSCRRKQSYQRANQSDEDDDDNGDGRRRSFTT